MTIKFAELSIRNIDEINEINSVLTSGQFINGLQVFEFADKWASMCNAQFCIPVSSGTAALAQTLKALLEPGSVVVVPEMSFIATAQAVNLAGCVPAYCDTLSCGLINWEQCRTVIHETNADAVMPVHLYGQVSIVPDSILDEVIVVEDACQAHGMKGVSGAAACFSFYPSKNLGAIGDAGAVVTNDEHLAMTVQKLSNYGSSPGGDKHHHGSPGDNRRMDTIQAAVLSMRTSKLSSLNYHRRHIASQYQRLGVPSIATMPTNYWHLYPILAYKRSKFRQQLYDLGVETGAHYPYVQSDFVPGVASPTKEVSTNIARHIVTLPIGPHISSEDVETVVEFIQDIAELEDGMWRLK